MSSIRWLQHAKVVCYYSLSVAQHAANPSYIVEYGYIQFAWVSNDTSCVC